jgi:hypothetical protein
MVSVVGWSGEQVSEKDYVVGPVDTAQVAKLSCSYTLRSLKSVWGYDEYMYEARPPPTLVEAGVFLARV